MNAVKTGDVESEDHTLALRSTNPAPPSQSRTQSSAKEVRIQKYLSACGVASRRRSEQLIQEGKVRVNGSVVETLGTKIVPGRDVVKVGNKVVHPQHKGVVLLHKPRGVVTTLAVEEERPTISAYLTKKTASYFPVGRLDIDSSGLVILSNDGALAEKLTHPRYQIPRVYQVKVRGRVTLEACELLASRGVRLDDGQATAQSVRLVERRPQATWLEITVTEGRNRLIRRMGEAIGHPVVKLHRIAHGPIRLGSLSPGEIHTLTESQYHRLCAQMTRNADALSQGKKARIETRRRVTPLRRGGARKKTHRSLKNNSRR